MILSSRCYGDAVTPSSDITVTWQSEPNFIRMWEIIHLPAAAWQHSLLLSDWMLRAAVLPGNCSSKETSSGHRLWPLPVSVAPPTHLLHVRDVTMMSSKRCNVVFVSVRVKHTDMHLHREPWGWKVIGWLAGALSQSDVRMQSWDFLHCCRAENLLPDLHSSSTHSYLCENPNPNLPPPNLVLTWTLKPGLVLGTFRQSLGPDSQCRNVLTVMVKN